MTTGVDILFKELPAQVPSVDRERRTASSPAHAGNANDSSNKSNNNDQKTIKTFNEHLDDHNVKNDANDKNSKTDASYSSPKKRNDEQANDEVTAAPEISTKINEQEPSKKTSHIDDSLLIAEQQQENIPAAAEEPTAVINTDTNNSAVVNNGTNNTADANTPPNQTDINTGTGIINPEQVAANTASQPNAEKTIPIATEKPQNVEKTIPVAKNDEAITKATTPQNNNNVDPAVVASSKNVASGKNIELKPDTSTNETPSQTGVEQGDKQSVQTQKSSNAQPGNIETVQITKDNENQMIAPSVTQKTDVPVQDTKTEPTGNVPLSQPVPLENALPKDTIVTEKDPTIAMATVLDKNNVQKPTGKDKNTGINLEKGAGKSKGSSAGQQKSEVSASNTGQATQTQQSASQNIAKNDMLFEMVPKAEPALPQPLNLNGQTSLTTGGLLAVQDINAQKSVSSLTSTIKSETAEQAKMVNEQISIAISKNILKGQNNFNIRLKPAELGQVEIRVEFLSDGKMQASMMVENEKTLSMLQRDQSVLEKALQDAGINLSNKSMNFSLMKQDQQQSQKFADLNNPANDDGNFDDIAHAETIQEIRMSYSNRTVDISV